MKNILTLSILVFSSFMSMAQREANEKVFSINIGRSFTAAIVNSVGPFLQDSGILQGYSYNSRPNISITGDIGLSEKWSIGILLANQFFSGTLLGYTYPTFDGNVVTENVSYRMNRNNISLTPKFHYNLKSDKIDMYLGWRIGYVFWNNKFETTQLNFNPFGLTFGRPNIGFVPFGVRLYASENLGGNFELAFGAPYIVSFGLQYRLPSTP
jgi:hypothetical protein